MQIKKIIIPGEPDTATAQEKGVKIRRSRTGRYYPQFYEKTPVRNAKEYLASFLRFHKPDEPIDGPIEVAIYYYFGRGSKPKKYIGAPKATKPDLDNMAKSLLDVMTALEFWHDDGQIARLKIEKYWAENEDAKIIIEVYTLQEVIQ